MNLRPRSTFAALSCLVAAAACTDVHPVETIRFARLSAPACTYDFNSSYAGGVADLDQGVPYLIGVTVENPLASNVDPASFRTNTHDAFLETYTIDFTTTPAGTALPQQTGELFAFIPATGSTAILDFPILSGSTIAALAAAPAVTSVMARLTFQGRTSDRTVSFSTAVAEFPVSVCRGCAVPPPDCFFYFADGTREIKRNFIPAVCLGGGAEPLAWSCLQQSPADNPNATIEFSPTTGTVAVGDTIEAILLSRNADGTTTDISLASAGTTYSVRTAAIASVDADGRITGVSEGATTVTATNDGRTASFVVTVTAAVP